MSGGKGRFKENLKGKTEPNVMVYSHNSSFWGLLQWDGKFEASLGNLGRPCLKIKKKKPKTEIKRNKMKIGRRNGAVAERCSSCLACTKFYILYPQ